MSNQKQMRIVTLTVNPAIDTTLGAKQVKPEHKLRCRLRNTEPGGGGLNVSRAIRRLGGDSLALYTHGGAYGRMLQSLLGEEGVSHKPVSISGLTRENIMVQEDTSTQQFRFTLPGPEMTEEDWNSVLNALDTLRAEPEYLVLSGSLSPGMPKNFYARCAEIVKTKGTKVILDTSRQALTQGIGSGVFIVKPNLRELSKLADRELTSEQDQEDAAKELIQQNKAKHVLVSLGAAGALWVKADTVQRLRTPTVPVKSKVGAGDSMVAGLVLALARGEDLYPAIQFGIAASAAAVMTPGSELCRKEDTEELFNRLMEKS
ncbi:MAG: 1-phosphofructokinase family hexose kinase [Spirochaetia bacterium]